ncbi:acylphosphatase, partial [Candidatus Micrarchaeota archaeon]|nr:acylphosphatase [Candidatus Micrarchaeota archaeon]
RAFVARIARELSLKGWTRNLKDGTVEVVVDGDISEFKKKIFVQGNPDSDYGLHVEELSEEKVEEKLPDSFEIRF